MDQGDSTKGGKRSYDDPVQKRRYKKKNNLNPKLRKERYIQRTQGDRSGENKADETPTRSSLQIPSRREKKEARKRAWAAAVAATNSGAMDSDSQHHPDDSHRPVLSERVLNTSIQSLPTQNSEFHQGSQPTSQQGSPAPPRKFRTRAPWTKDAKRSRKITDKSTLERTVEQSSSKSNNGIDAGVEPIARNISVEPRSPANDVPGEYFQEGVVQGSVKNTIKAIGDEGREIDIDALLAHLGDEQAHLRVDRAEDSILENAGALDSNNRQGTLEYEAGTDGEVVANGNGVVGQAIIQNQNGGAVEYHGLEFGTEFSVTDTQPAQDFPTSGLEGGVPRLGLEIDDRSETNLGAPLVENLDDATAKGNTKLGRLLEKHADSYLCKSEGDRHTMMYFKMSPTRSNFQKPRGWTFRHKTSEVAIGDNSTRDDEEVDCNQVETLKKTTDSLMFEKPSDKTIGTAKSSRWKCDPSKTDFENCDDYLANGLPRDAEDNVVHECEDRENCGFIHPSESESESSEPLEWMEDAFCQGRFYKQPLIHERRIFRRNVTPPFHEGDPRFEQQ